MKDDVLHAIDIKNVLTNSLIGLILGCLLTFVPMSILISLMITMIGIYMIIVNGYKIYVRFSNNEKSSNEMLFEVISALIGFMLIFLNGVAITIITSIYLIALPVYNIILLKGDRKAIMNNLPSIVIGVILLVCGLSTFDILFKILGVIVILASLGYLGYNCYLYKKSGVKVIK